MKNKKLTEQSFTQGAAVLLFSTVLVKLIGAFFKIPLSSDYCLGDLGFGYFSFGYDIYIPIYTLACSGFPVAISKIMSDYMAKENFGEAQSAFKLFRRILLFFGLLGFAGICLVVIIGDIFKNNRYTMFAMAPAVIFSCLASVYRGAFESYRNMTPTAVSNIIEALSKVVFGFGAAFITVRLTGNAVYGAAAAMAGITLGTVLAFLYLRISYSRKFKTAESKSTANTDRLLKKLILISLPIVFASFAGSMISLIDAVTVNWQLSAMMEKSFNEIAKGFGSVSGLTAETLPTFLYGLRSKAYTLFHLVPTFVSALAISALPMITSHFSSRNRQKAGENVNMLLKFSSVVTFPLSMGMIFAGKAVMNLLYGGNSWVYGGRLLSIYGFAAIGAGLTMALTAVLQSCGKQNTAFINFAVGIILKLIFNIVLVGIESINIYGSAISTAICYLYITFTHFAALKKSGITFDFKNTILKPFIAALACGITAFLICLASSSKIVTLSAIFAAAVVYLLLLVLQKTFTKSDFSGLSIGRKS